MRKRQNKVDKQIKKNIPSGRRRPRGLVKGGKGALFTSTRSLAQFLEIIKNFFFPNLIRRTKTPNQAKLGALRREPVKTIRLFNF